MKIIDILSQIDVGQYALPEFQRGYVWNRDQVRKLMKSLYNDYPIGQLLIWVTKTNAEITRGEMALQPGYIKLILDGQQRITSLYGIIRGNPPKFFDGNENSFLNLYFNLEEEVFEFYSPKKMDGNIHWISVTDVMIEGAGKIIQKNPSMIDYIERLNKLDGIKSKEIHIEEVSDESKNIDIIVDIFNNVNTGGTKLSKGDLALAKVCGQWPDGRNEMKKILSKFQNAGYYFSLEWLLRCITVYLTNNAYFKELENVPIFDIQKGLKDVEKLIGTCLDHIGSRLGLDHDRVLAGHFSIIIIVAYLKQNGGKLSSGKDWDKLLYWYVHTFLWGRYASSTESVLAQDLNTLSSGAGLDGLIQTLRQNRGDLTIHSDDFRGWSTGSRFYPLLYLLTRTCHTLDLESGIELSNSLLGKNSSLEVHHIFPKKLLYEAGRNKAEVNSLANYTFITKDANLSILCDEPRTYFPKCESKHPGVLSTHWIPMQPDCWELKQYSTFLDKRRELLANAANVFLNSLLKGEMSETIIESYSNRTINTSIRTNQEPMDITDTAHWMDAQGLDSGIENYELVDDNGKPITVIDLAWPNGIQSGKSEKIALMLNESEDALDIVNRNGYKYFTDKEEFMSYINNNYLI